MTADSKTFLALLAILDAAAGVLFFAGKVRASFAVGALTIVFILAVVCSNWQRVGGGEILFLLVALSLLSAAIAGALGRLSVRGWWLIWIANLSMLVFSAYGAFVFRIF